MTATEELTIAVIATALVFDFVNGFHDAANSIATIVATKVLKPRQAVLWAAFFNFVALFLFGTEVAQTVGNGMVALDAVTTTVILAGLMGAVVWGLITWRFGIPTSSSHALIGGYAGAAMTHSALTHGWQSFYDPIIPSGWARTIIFIVVAPMIGLILGHSFMRLTLLAEARMPKKGAARLFRIMQLFSSAFLSLMHGSNDAQKTAGVIAGALVAGGITKEFTVSKWVLAASYTMMGFGTFFGGWRIVKTMGEKLTRLHPDGGFAAETGSAFSILLATMMGLPVSTTHVTTGAICGAGSAKGVKNVHWDLAGRIMWAWVFTIPAAAIMGGLIATAAYFLAGRS